MAQHDARKIAVIIITVFMFVVMVAFNALAATSDGAGNTITVFFSFYQWTCPPFHHNGYPKTTNATEKKNTEINRQSYRISTCLGRTCHGSF